MSYRELFDRLNEREIAYVVPRKYDNLPDATVDDDGDLDIVFHPEQFQTGVDICESLGFSSKGADSGDRVELIRMAVRNPETTVNRLASAPVEVARMAVTGERPSVGNPRHRNVKRYRNGAMVDLRDGLAYSSPMDGTRIPVDPSVTRRLLARRRQQGCYYVPEPADELAHIVPHCVFDKGGEFSQYYVDRCRSLFDIVRSDPERRERFEELLEEIFFEAAELVSELVAEERYSELRTALWQFSEY
ncbi:MAG: hypothetical protein V5A45_04130 [Haloarculaceae archaeon]